MKILLFMVPILFMISCGDAFDAAEVSECIQNPVVLTVGDGETQDIEMDDSDVEFEEPGEIVSSVIMISQTKEALKFYYQGGFACDGYENGYNASVDPSDETALLLEITRKDIWPHDELTCVCLKQMAVEYSYSSETEDLSKITRIKLFDGEPYEEYLTFE